MRSILSIFKGLHAINVFSHFLKRNQNHNVKKDDSDLLQFLDDHPQNYKTPQWKSWSVTNKGKVRKHNQDSVLDSAEVGLWVVADGMGGHKAGDVASQLIVSSLQKLSLTSSSLENKLNEVKTCLKKVNTELRDFSAKECGGDTVGSTVVALINNQKQCAFVWAGDSRLYRLRNRKLQQLTRDHCQEEDENMTQSAAHLITKKSNIITRAVGAYTELELDSKIIDVNEGDVFLLCSDGLDKEMSFNEIETVMTTNKTQDIKNILFEKTLERGSRDNISIIVIETDSLDRFK